jgi:hypothetical protein
VFWVNRRLQRSFLISDLVFQKRERVRMVKIKRGDEWQHRASSPLGIVLLSEKSIVSFPFFPTHHATFAIPFLVPDDIRNRRRSALRFCRVLTNTVKRGALRWGGRIILTAHVQTFRTLTGLVFIFAGDVRGSDRVKKNNRGFGSQGYGKRTANSSLPPLQPGILVLRSGLRRR